jgi:hypothetical protein
VKNLTWQNPEQLFVAQELINKVKSKCCGIKDKLVGALNIAFGENQMNLGKFMDFITNGWFVRAYVVLYVLSPVLNAFINKASKKQFALTVLFYWILSFYWGWIFNFPEFVNGYSFGSFVGLYLFGRYIRLYPMKMFQLNKYFDLLIYVVLVFVSALLCLLPCFAHFPTKICNAIICHSFSYIYPFVIIESIYLLLFFSKLKFQSKTINWIAASAFAVYMIHCGPMYMFFHKTVIMLWKYSTFIHVIYAFIFLCATFVACVFFDKIRIYAWNLLWDKCIVRFKWSGASFNDKSENG